MAVPVTRIAVTDLESWPLRTPADMLEALDELEEKGWDGAIDRNSSTWSLRLSASGKQTINAVIGEWLILDGELKKVVPDHFPDQYEAPEGVEFPSVTAEEPEVPQVEEAVIEVSADSVVPIARTVR